MLCNSRLPWVCGFFFLSAVPAHAEQADTENIRQQIVSDWQRRQAAASTVRYVAKGTCTIPKGKHNGEPGSPPGAISPPQDVTYEVQRTWLFDFKAGRLRKEVRDFTWVTMKQQFLPRYQEVLFDGAIVRIFRPRENNRELETTHRRPEILVYDKGDRMHMLRDTADLPLYFAHGVIYTGDELQKTILSPIPADRLRIDAAGGEVASEGGRYAMVSLRAESESLGMVVRYRLNLDQDSAVQSCEVFFQGTKITDMRIEQQATDRGWYPEQWSYTVYNTQGAVFETGVFRLTSTEFGPECEASSFSVQPRPGSVVSTPTGHYRAGADGRSMDRLTQGVRDPLPEAEGPTWIPAVAILALVLCSILVFLNVRRAHRGIS